jgi:hypothetical protein
MWLDINAGGDLYMDIGNIGLVGTVVVVLVGAIKDSYPLTGNQTRLAALVIGLILGLLGQVGLLPGVTVDVTTGILSAVAAVATVTVADRVGVRV